MKFSVIGLHFLAFPNDERRAPEREAQADAVRMMAVDEAAAGYEPIVLGDFNDYDGSPEAMDHIDHRLRTRVMELLRGMDPASISDDLANASQWFPKAQRYTAFWDQDGDFRMDMPHEASSIDHVLLPPSLASKVDVVRIPRDHTPADTSDHWSIVVTFLVAAPQPVPAAGDLKLFELVPNPAGDENQNEWISLKNFGTAGISLIGWKVRGAANTTWDLDANGSVASGVVVKIMRQGRAMGMNNTGDTIELIDAAGMVLDRVVFARVEEAEVVSAH